MPMIVEKLTESRHVALNAHLLTIEWHACIKTDTQEGLKGLSRKKTTRGNVLPREKGHYQVAGRV